MDEFAIIRRVFAPLAKGFPGAFALTDDAAVMKPPRGVSLVVTTDGLVEGVHFLPGEKPEALARRLLRVNLSDLAAMGAQPYAYLLNLTAPVNTSMPWFKAFASGLAAEQRAFGLSLIGGDTDAAPTLAMTATMIGLVARGRVLRRNGARAGDDLYVSGTIGDAGLGLSMLKQGRGRLEAWEQGLVRRWRLPTPRVELGQRLIGVASAAIDISDGLAADVGRLCRESGVGATIELARVPLSPAARRTLTGGQPYLLSLLKAGEDYELAFTAPVSARGRLQRLGASLGVPLTRIGRMRRGRSLAFADDKGHETKVRDGGYRHFGRLRRDP